MEPPSPPMPPPPDPLGRPVASVGLGGGSRVADLSVVVVTYNVRDLLEQALRSVYRAASGLSIEVFVVDNDSADGTARMVRTRFPDAHLIANESNVGFAAANNQAIRLAEGRHVLVLNPDTVVQEDTLRTLVDFMDRHPEAGAAGCRILNPDGTFAPESRRAFPTPSVAFYRMTGLGKLFPRSPRFGRYNLTFLPRDEVCEVDALSGSCMIVRRQALAVDAATAREAGSEAPADPGSGLDLEAGSGGGLLDEGFFMYGEDLDWCYRIQQAGWKIFYTPSTQIIHYKGESTKKGELRYVRLFYGAMLRFAEKHFVQEAGGTSKPERSLLTWAMCRAIQLAIVLRAALSAAGQLFHSLRRPLLDLGLSYAALAAGAVAWSPSTPLGLGPDYFQEVAPVYAAVVVLAIAACGGYGRGSAQRVRPALAGLALAFLSIAAAGFFVKTIAFSRMALALGFAASAVILPLYRLSAQRPTRSRRALLVGTAADADRLCGLLNDRPVRLRTVPRPHLEAVGYVSARTEELAADPALTHLGPIRQLRDLARLHNADEIVFAAASLPNSAILGQMRALRDLPLQFTIMAGYRDCLIGKASVVDLAATAGEPDRLVAPVRSPAVLRALELSFALAGLLLLLPLATILGTKSDRMRSVAHRLRSLEGVLSGSLALVGFVPGTAAPPSVWGLRPGAFSILDLVPHSPGPAGDEARTRAYAFYARHQSDLLDAEIALRAVHASFTRSG